MNLQSEVRFASYPGIRPPRLPKRSTARIRLATAALVVGLLASLASAASAGDSLCPMAETPHAEPGALFETIEAAAVDALASMPRKEARRALERCARHGGRALRGRANERLSQMTSPR